MDSPYFEVKVRITPDVLRLVYTVQFFKKQKVGITLPVLGALLIALGAITAISSMLLDSVFQLVSSAVNVVLGVMLILMSAQLVSATAKSAYKNHVNSNLPTVATRKITEDRIETFDEQGHGFIKWSQITDGYYYKNHIVLFYGNVVSFIRLDEIMVGSADALLEFVKERVPLK